jgi:hypothetical protein
MNISNDQYIIQMARAAINIYFILFNVTLLTFIF